MFISINAVISTGRKQWNRKTLPGIWPLKRKWWWW